MEHYDAATYGDRIARIYDDRYSTTDPVQLDRLVELAGDGPVLELGIGTGRLALPLLARGVHVEGIDASPAMIERLRAKPQGDQVPVTIADFAHFELDRTFSLIFVVLNTFFALPDQQAQVACFADVARHLQPGGRFLIEAFVPKVTRFTDEQEVRTVAVETGSVELLCSRHDPIAQRVESQHIVIDEGGLQLYPVQIRYAWPSELDLMGRLAGLELESRSGGWQGEAFSASSNRHVSIWRSPGS